MCVVSSRERCSKSASHSFLRFSGVAVAARPWFSSLRGKGALADIRSLLVVRVVRVYSGREKHGSRPDPVRVAPLAFHRRTFAAQHLDLGAQSTQLHQDLFLDLAPACAVGPLRLTVVGIFGTGLVQGL